VRHAPTLSRRTIREKRRGIGRGWWPWLHACGDGECGPRRRFMQARSRPTLIPVQKMTRFHFSVLLGPFALVIGFSSFWFSDTIADPDLWGHIRFGQDVLRTGSIVQADVYSYRTGNQPWINHEWLSEVIFAALYDLGGAAGLIGFKVLVSVLLLGLSYAHLRRGGLEPYCAAALLLLISIPFRLGLGTIRPQIFTYLFFLFELLLLKRAEWFGAHWLWMLPVLFGIWVNLHGGVLAGVGVLGVWSAVRMVARPRDDASRPVRRLRLFLHLVLIGLACALALCLNPYGAGLVSFLLRTATVPRPEIREWLPLSLMSLPGQLYLLLLVIGIAGLVGSRRRPTPESILIFSVTALLTLVSNRHYPLFALALVVMGGEHIADAWNHWRRPSGNHRGRGGWTATVNVFGSLVLVALSFPRFSCIRVEPFYFAFPARAVALLKQSGLSGNMAVPFDWGEYVLWHLGPRVKVSIDGRRETIYSDEAYQRSRDFERGTGAWDSLLKTTTTDLVLAQNGSPTANLMSRSDGWVPLYQDKFCLIFARAALPSLAQIVDQPIPALPDNGNGLCFPAPARADSAFSVSEIRRSLLPSRSR
jgi:hypothetical protein